MDNRKYAASIVMKNRLNYRDSRLAKGIRSLRRGLSLALASAVLIVSIGDVQADGMPEVRLIASISEQQMTVELGQAPSFSWPVSTARAGKITPKGRWTAKWLSKDHRSSRYNNAPMPYSIFYDGNFAIHGTTQVDKIGTPASAGCVRLHPDNAAILFHLAEQVGLDNVIIEVVE